MSEALRLGTLGSAATFAGEATARACEVYPGFGEVSYWPSMDALWDALARGAVDSIVIGIERTGQPHEGHPLTQHPYVVTGQLPLRIVCNLYVKPGTRKEDIRKITGHGSILQCKPYLDANFGGVPREVHALNSVAAAHDVLAGDGTLAVVGSRSVAQVVPGLEIFATGIDSGAISNWWVISSKPIFGERPTGLVVTGRFGPGGDLSAVISALFAQGYALRSMGNFPVDSGVSVYDHVLSFAGQGMPLATIQSTLAAFPAARLAGAFQRAD